MIEQEKYNPFPELNLPTRFWKQTGSIIQQYDDEGKFWHSICSQHGSPGLPDNQCERCRIGQWHELQK